MRASQFLYLYIKLWQHSYITSDTNDIGDIWKTRSPILGWCYNLCCHTVHLMPGSWFLQREVLHLDRISVWEDGNEQVWLNNKKSYLAVTIRWYIDVAVKCFRRLCVLTVPLVFVLNRFPVWPTLARMWRSSSVSQSKNNAQNQCWNQFPETEIQSGFYYCIRMPRVNFLHHGVFAEQS